MPRVRLADGNLDLVPASMPQKPGQSSVGDAKKFDQRAVDVLSGGLAMPAKLQKPGQMHDDLFVVNTGMAQKVVEACARHHPIAAVAQWSLPWRRCMKRKGLDPKRTVA